MRINVLSGTKLTFYQFCTPPFHDWIIKLLHEEGELISRDQIDVDEKAFPSQILKVIDLLVDSNGANAIETLNAINWQEITKIENILSKTSIKSEAPELYSKYLIESSNESAINLEADSKVKILQKTHSYGIAFDSAKAFLKSNNYSRRVYISYDSRYSNFIVYYQKFK
jgi:hypothetical protein